MNRAQSKLTARPLSSRCCSVTTAALLLLGTLFSALAGAETEVPEQPAPLSCPEHQLAPFTARYDVYRNGKRLGKSLARLKKTGAEWTYLVTTAADRGLAGFLGGKITERSEFRVEDSGNLQSLNYEYQQGIRFSRREGKASFDWQRLEVAGVHKKKDFRLPLVAGQTDRMLLNLKLMRMLSQGHDEFTFDTVERGKVDRMAFGRGGNQEMVDTPTGRLVTVQVSRKHRNPLRETHSWHAPELGYLPVHMKAIDGDDDEIIEMRLVEWDREACEA